MMQYVFQILLLCFPLIFLNAQQQNNVHNIQKLLDKNTTYNQSLKSLIENSIVTDDYIDQHNGVRHIYLQQIINGLPIKGSYMNLHLYQDKIISTSNNYTKIKDAPVKTPVISKQQAVIVYAQSKGKQIELNRIETLTETELNVVDFAESKVRIKPSYLLVDGSLKLIWDADMLVKENHKWVSISIDAITGKILHEESWTYECAHNHEAPSFIPESNFKMPVPMAAPKMPMANQYHVFDYPIESPLHGNRSYVASPWNNASNASPIGWHNDGFNNYTYTRGNNVYAREDTLANDVGGFSPSSPSLQFDYPYMMGNQLYENMSAGITNAFYWANLMHDVWYQYGFDEQSGNFQNSNFGNGGNGSDFVILDTRDGSSNNNAVFGSPPDGSNGYMEMYEWTPSRSYYLKVNAPSNLAGYYWALPGLLGSTLDSIPIIADIELVNDGTTNPTEGCSTLVNDLTGKIALIDRGNCTFQQKVKNAQDAGAIACIVCNNVHGGPSTMTGNDPTISIPSVMISLSDCQNLKTALTQNQTITAQLATFDYFPLIDASFDNGIVAHEYGHGISTRLTGGPSINCLSNQEQMGEGWSDWFALVMTIEPSDQPTDVRGIGTYVSGQNAWAGGIRPKPYSTDFAINDYTYGGLCNPEISVPHGVGFVWATMLWDLTWAFINQHGFDADLYNGTGGNNQVMQLIMDAMKLQPCNPGFIDGRDAILVADQINNNGANQELIWQVFANRGLGYSAYQGSSNNRCDGIEAFDMPPQYVESIKIQKLVDINEAYEGDTITYTLIVRNDLNYTVSNIQVTDTLDQNVTYQSSVSVNTISKNNGIISYTIPQLNSGEQDSVYIKVAVNYNLNAHTIFSDGMETGGPAWLVSNGAGVGNWEIDGSNPYSGDSCWYASNPDYISDKYVRLNCLLDAGQPFLTFKHYFNTELYWDGGVVEISTDYGATWNDLGNNMISNGYNGLIEVNDDSAISGREAFTGHSINYITTVVDLADYAGQVAFIRFRFASDAYVGGDGWYIDDVKVFGGQFIPNQASCNSSFGYVESNNVTTMVVPQIDNKFRVKVLFEGYADPSNNLMPTTFSQQSLLPTNQPFLSLPPAYNGNESITNFAPTDLSNITDWVLVGLRSESNPAQVIEQHAALIRNDGVIVDTNGNEGVLFSSINSNSSYYLSIIHQGHLQIHSANPLLPGQSIDFTLGVQQAAGNNQMIDIGNGKTAMFVGDYDMNGVINNLDYNSWHSNSAAVGGYFTFDGDGNAIINNLDYNKWYANRSKVGLSNP